MMLYVWFVIAGAFAGVSAGLFGVGGGMIIVPALVWIFTAYDFSPEVVTHLAIGTSLATIVVTSISSLTAHNKRGGVRWEVWRKMALGLVIGSLVGAGIADMIDGQALQAIIGVGALLVALKMLFFSNKEQVGKPLPPAGVQFGAMENANVAAKFDLNVAIQWSDDQLEVAFIYDTGLFTQPRMSQLHGDFIALLEVLAHRSVTQALPELHNWLVVSDQQRDYLLHSCQPTRQAVDANSQDANSQYKYYLVH